MINIIYKSINNLPLSVIALLFMVVSGMFAASMHCLIRVAALESHPFQIAFFRTLFVLIIFLPVVMKEGFKSLYIVNKKLQFSRAIIGSGAMCCMFYGISITELSKATALMFTVPIFSTILAILFFKEQVGIRRWTAMIVGFMGAIIVIRPDIQLGLGPLLILCGSFIWSMSLLIAKKLTKTESNISMTFWQAAGLIPATLIVAIPFWSTPNLEQLFLFLLVALTGTMTHYCLNAALAKADISSLLPLDYLRLIWSVSLGFIFFNEVPLITIWIGSAIIILSTSYIAYRQMKKSKHPLINELNSNL